MSFLKNKIVEIQNIGVAASAVSFAMPDDNKEPWRCIEETETTITLQRDGKTKVYNFADFFRLSFLVHSEASWRMVVEAREMFSGVKGK